MNNIAIILFALSGILLQNTAIRAQSDYFNPEKNNPVLPAFLADPSFVKMNDRYYIYATTVSKHMEPMVWISEDLERWNVEPLGIYGEHFFWAPSVIKGKDNRYYLYYTSGFDFKCHLYIGESPSGPWQKNGLVDEGFDLQIFEDPVSGKIYGSSSDPSSRPRLVEFENDPKKDGYMKKVIREKSIEGSFFDYTEGSFILYKDGWYYFMYSGGKCSAETYKVNYARSEDIWGPYEDAPNNPILSTDKEKNIIGPGHHSVFELDDEYYIVYHREDIYFAPTCSERQVCIDKMEFDNQGWINKVIPTNEGIDFNKKIERGMKKSTNLAFGKNVTAGGIVERYNPEFAVDNNLATRWIGSKFLAVDLNKVYTIEEIIPEFVYYDYFNLYKILYSNDNQNWELYFDQSRVAKKAWAPIQQKTIKARYVKIEFIRGEGNPASLSELIINGY